MHTSSVIQQRMEVIRHNPETECRTEETPQIRYFILKMKTDNQIPSLQNESLFIFFLFQLQLANNVTLASAVPHSVNSNIIIQEVASPLALHVVVTIVPTVFPVLHFASLRLFCDYRFVLRTSTPFSTQSARPYPSGSHQFESVFFKQ